MNRYRILAGIFCLLATGNVLAEEADTLKVVDVEEITVIAAPKENRKLREQPAAVTLLSQQDMQKKQGELLEPIIVKAQDAVKEVSKAGGYTVVYDTSVNAVAYFDEAVVTDILPAVKTKLGIKDTPAAAPAAPAAK